MQNQTSGAEWLTVKQFAVASGCTTQAVYKQLATRLQPYTKRENGRTLINSAALSATKLQPVDNRQQVDNQLQTGATFAELAALDALRDQISRQADELTAARAALDSVRTELTRERDQAAEAEQRAAVLAAELTAAQGRADDAERRERDRAAADAAQLAAKDKQLADLAAALHTAQQAQTELTAALTAAQALHAGTIRGQIDTAAQPADDAGAADRAQAVQDADQGGTDQPRPKRRGLFARLFRRG